MQRMMTVTLNRSVVLCGVVKVTSIGASLLVNKVDSSVHQQITRRPSSINKAKYRSLTSNNASNLHFRPNSNSKQKLSCSDGNKKESWLDLNGSSNNRRSFISPSACKS
jgi:hypothetical protein